MEPSSTGWQLTADTASFICSELKGEVSLLDPSYGMSLTYGKTAIKGSLWSYSDLLGGKVKPTETYLRGNDLVLSMPATKSFPCETIWYWSVSPLLDSETNSLGVTIRLTLSLQTDLLDTSPVVKLVSPLASDESGKETDRISEELARSLAINPGVWSCFEAAHPSDQSECLVEKQVDIESLSITLPFLEKGVIRRARMAAFFLFASAAPATLKHALDDFIEEPLPLTT